MPRTSGVQGTLLCPHLHFLNIGSSLLHIVQRAHRFVPSAFCLLLLLTIHQSSLTRVYAQSASATLSGTVVDQNGAVVPAVNITVINIGQGFQRTTTTSNDG